MGFEVKNGVLEKYIIDEYVNEVTVPDGVKKISESAFSGCENLTSISLPNGVTQIGENAFSDCKNLTSINLPEKLKKIDSCAFEGCSGLTSISLPDGLKEIGSRAFSGCSELTSINLPEKLKKIGSCAFEGCSSLTSISIPDGVTEISQNTFGETSKLNVESYYIPNVDLSKYDAGYKVIYSIYYLTTRERHNDKEKAMYDSYINKQKKRMMNSIIENSAIAALNCIFKMNIITAKNIDEYIETADKGHHTEALVLLKNYKNENISKKDIEKEEQRQLNAIVNYNPNSFSELKKIWSYKKLDYGTVSITSYKREDTDIFVPNRIGKSVVSVIGENAFSPECERIKNSEARKKITSITLPKSIMEIGERAFSGCSSLTNISLYDGLKKIGEYAFYNCKSLTGISLLDGVKKIGSNAFEGCGKLTSITLPDSVTSIGSDAFLGSAYYENSANWEDGVLYIGRHLIRANASVTSDYIVKPDTLCIGERAFYGCRSLINIKVPENNEKHSDIDGVLFNKEKTELIYYPGGKKDCSYDIPEGVMKIDSYAFSDCGSLTSISLPEGVMKIDDYAFYGCNSLISITIPEGVTKIGSYVFQGCSSLTSISLPESVKEIDKYAFTDCKSLTHITIPASVEKIDWFAFTDCNCTIQAPKGSYAEHYAMVFDIPFKAN